MFIPKNDELVQWFQELVEEHGDFTGNPAELLEHFIGVELPKYGAWHAVCHFDCDPNEGVEWVKEEWTIVDGQLKMVFSYNDHYEITEE